MTDRSDSDTTDWAEGTATPTPSAILGCHLEVVSGPDRGRKATFGEPIVVIGRGAADFKVSDRLVSSQHVELQWTTQGYRIRDLGSKNGTYLGSARVLEGFIDSGVVLTIGDSVISCRWEIESDRAPPSSSKTALLERPAHYRTIIGTSPKVRQVLELVDRLAPSQATILILGETGTGKELFAEAIHRGSPRAAGPFMVVDCSSIPKDLFEDQLFGHEMGSFTGADRNTSGVFEAAKEGTVFLDEIGELPLGMQAKLLRVLESRQIRKIGSNRVVTCDVRIVAATHRDLAAEVKRGAFRADLYYRLAVANIILPPLRERREDIEPLVEHFRLQLDPTGKARLPRSFVKNALRHGWPGNLRELRNAVEHALIPDIDASLPFSHAKQMFVDEFDRKYLEAILTANEGNIAAAARAAGMDRMTIYKILRRLKPNDPQP
jgi:transcriptional regulator with PAS, ATPase and Fis domain